MDQKSLLKEFDKTDYLELMVRLPSEAWFHLLEALLDHLKGRFPDESIKPLSAEDAKLGLQECMAGFRTALANFILKLRNPISSDSEDEVGNAQADPGKQQSSPVMMPPIIAIPANKVPPVTNVRRSHSASQLPGMAYYMDDDMESVVDSKPVCWKPKPASGLPSYATPARGRVGESPEVIDVEADIQRLNRTNDFTSARRRLDQWEESSESECDSDPKDITSVCSPPLTYVNSRMNEMEAIIGRQSSPRPPSHEPTETPWLLRKVLVPRRDDQEWFRHIVNRLLQDPGTLGKKDQRRDEDPRYLKANQRLGTDAAFAESKESSSPTRSSPLVIMDPSPSVLSTVTSPPAVASPSPPSAVVPTLNIPLEYRVPTPNSANKHLPVGASHKNASSCFASPDSLPSNDHMSRRNKISMFMIPSPEPSVIDVDRETESACIAPLNAGLAKTGEGGIDLENPLLKVHELEACLRQRTPNRAKRVHPISPSRAVFPAHVLMPCGQPAPVPPPVLATPKPSGISFTIGTSRPKLQPQPFLAPPASTPKVIKNALYTPFDSPSPVNKVPTPTISPLSKVPPPPPKIGTLANRLNESRPDLPSRSPSPSLLPKAYRKEPASTRSRRSRTRTRSRSSSPRAFRKEPRSTRSRRSKTRSSSSGRSRSRSRSISPKRYKRRSRTPKRFKKRYSRRSSSRSSSGGRLKRRYSRSSSSSRSRSPVRSVRRKQSPPPVRSRKRTPSPSKSVKRSSTPDIEALYFS